MRSSRNFSAVAEKLKAKIGVVQDRELAAELGVAKSAYATRKRNKSIFYEEIIALCEKRGISLDWLFLDRPERNDGAIIANHSVVGDGNQNIHIGAKDFADFGEVAKIVENLRYAPKPFLDNFLDKLLQFRALFEKTI
jgi:transcriptional regulator with XRE-family HTH domain